MHKSAKSQAKQPTQLAAAHAGGAGAQASAPLVSLLGARHPAVQSQRERQQLISQSPQAQAAAHWQAIANRHGNPPLQRVASPVMQRRSQVVSITGTTHLVEINQKSLYQGESQHPILRSGDLVTIDTAHVIKSRRGPNQEDPDLRKADATGPHIYRHYKVLAVNGQAVSGPAVYLRDLTFKRSDATEGKDYAADLDQLVAAQQHLKDFQTRSEKVVAMLRSLLETYETDELAAPIQDIETEIQKGETGRMSEVATRLGVITGMMTHLHKQVEPLAYTAQRGGEANDARQLIGIAEAAYQLSETGKGLFARPTGPEASTHKDALGTAMGQFDTGQTAIHGLAGGIVGAVALAAEEGSFLLGFSTGFGYVAAPLGTICGGIGLGLGIKVWHRGKTSEKELEALLPNLGSAKIRRIAAYAKEKKRKKKYGGAIAATAGGAALAAGIFAIVAISVSTMGIGAAVIGIGAALIGLSIVLGKWYHRHKKRQAWKGKMAELVLGALDAGDTAAFPPHLMDLGLKVQQSPPDSPAQTAARTALEDACVAMAESRRTLLSQETVHYLLQGSPQEKFDANLLLQALHLDPAKIQQTARSKGNATAASLVARKLKSW